MNLKKIFPLCLVAFLIFNSVQAQTVLVYHTIQTDSDGNMIPWYNADPGISYDHDLGLIWNLWKNVPLNGSTKYYMTDHTYGTTQQANKVGGDQFAMALSSWELYYGYTGDTSIINDIKYIANTYLANSLSPGSYVWANVPYPSNTSNPGLPVYDGDYEYGAGYTQPDKAGSFGYELVNLFKITGDSSYLNAAVNIANTMAANVTPGDSTNPPYAFRVNAQTGAAPTLLLPGSNYTTNFTATLSLFESLVAMGIGNTTQYNSAYNTIKAWLQRYPQHDNNWGCFFEDIPLASNTEINAVTMARYILNHPDWDNTYQQDARAILDWTFQTFQDTVWNQYGATAIFEQSVDLKPGGSHTSRYASTELLYSQITGDTTHVAEAIRELNWATYLCDTDGEVRFSPSEGSVWYTDGYGDYVRHFIRAMGAYPQIAPYNANHLLATTSVITSIGYYAQEIDYNIYDSSSTETLRLTSKPTQVTVDGIAINEESNLNAQGWVWIPYTVGGAIKVMHTTGHTVKISWYPLSVNSIAANKINAYLYPNPTTNRFTLNYTLTSEQNVNIELTNVSGQKVKDINVHAQGAANTQTINVADLAPGIYFVKLTANEGSFLNKLIVGSEAK